MQKKALSYLSSSALPSLWQKWTLAFFSLPPSLVQCRDRLRACGLFTSTADEDLFFNPFSDVGTDGSVWSHKCVERSIHEVANSAFDIFPIF